MKYSGIDLHSNNSVVVITDEEDRIIFQKRMANDLKAIEMVLAPHRGEIVDAGAVDREHPRAADGWADEWRGDQAADGRSSRGVWFWAGCDAGAGGQPDG